MQKIIRNRKFLKLFLNKFKNRVKKQIRVKMEELETQKSDTVKNVPKIDETVYKELQALLKKRKVSKNKFISKILGKIW